MSPPWFPFVGVTASQPHRNLRRVGGRLSTASVGGRALRSLGDLETRTVDPVDALVEATIEVVDLRVRGVTVVGPHDLLDARADDRIGGLLKRHILELSEHHLLATEMGAIPLRWRDKHVDRLVRAAGACLIHPQPVPGRDVPLRAGTLQVGSDLLRQLRAIETVGAFVVGAVVAGVQGPAIISYPATREVSGLLGLLENLGHLRLVQDRLAQSCTDRKSTRLNSSHVAISYAVFCLKKKRTISST